MRFHTLQEKKAHFGGRIYSGCMFYIEEWLAVILIKEIL
jgi:hypothetical protein